jgi:hypothetical protein
MSTERNLDALVAADPARRLEPSAEVRQHSRAQLDALLAAQPSRRPARRPRALAAGLAAIAAVVAVAAGSLGGDTASPAQAFANRLQGDGIVHMVLAPERVHEASGDHTNPRRDELWMSLADGRWRVRTRLYGFVYDMAFDGRTITTYSSRTGKTTEDTPSDPSQLAGHPFPGPLRPGVQPLRDVESNRLKVAGEATIDGETVYDLIPTRALPEGLEMHWYVSKDGRLRRMVQSASDTVDESSGSRGPTSLTTDVETYDVLAPTEANQDLLRARR